MRYYNRSGDAATMACRAFDPTAEVGVARTTDMMRMVMTGKFGAIRSSLHYLEDGRDRSVITATRATKRAPTS